MSTEREEWEMAAKAVGFELVWSGPDREIPCRKDTLQYWAPRDDDGDALRLAVTLGIERIFVLRLGPNGVCVDGSQEPQTAPVFEHAVHRVAFDPYAATRLAIFRAAVEIGRAMP